jgi:hypothetical protein
MRAASPRIRHLCIDLPENGACSELLDVCPTIVLLVPRGAHPIVSCAALIAILWAESDEVCHGHIYNCTGVVPGPCSRTQ